jgi:hypothetical protein
MPFRVARFTLVSMSSYLSEGTGRNPSVESYACPAFLDIAKTIS